MIDWNEFLRQKQDRLDEGLYFCFWHNLKTPKEQLAMIGNGGVSGQPIKDQSTKVIQYLSDKSNKSFPIIGVGGIHSAADAIEKINAGADLVQIYTGFIYEGPGLIKKINKKILANE